MKAKHTPGPWTHGFSDGSGSVDIDTDGIRSGGWIVAGEHAAHDESVTVVSGGYDSFGVPEGVVGRTQEEAEANARLISAAPELLEAAIKASNLMKQLSRLMETAPGKNVTKMLDNAINKATGKE